VQLPLNTCGAVNAHLGVNIHFSVGLRKQRVVLSVIPPLWGGSPPPHPLLCWGHLRAALPVRGTERSLCLARVLESVFILGSLRGCSAHLNTMHWPCWGTIREGSANELLFQLCFGGP